MSFIDLEFTIEALKRSLDDSTNNLKTAERMLGKKQNEVNIAQQQLKIAQDKVRAVLII